MTPTSTSSGTPDDGPDPSGQPTAAGPRRIPEATVTRLPVYQRILEELIRAGTTTVSSELLASLARVNAAKVRKDLSLLGSFGTRGAGYDAAFLVEQIDRALGLDQVWPVVIVGIGNLGRALANSQGFSARGFRVAALFDTDTQVVGEHVGELTVRHLDELADVAAVTQPAIGVVATPAGAAQQVAERLVAVGIRSLLNFAPRVLTVPPEVLIRYVDLSIELQVMSFYQAREAASAPAGAEGPGPARTGVTGAPSDGDGEPGRGRGPAHRAGADMPIIRSVGLTSKGTSTGAAGSTAPGT
ncbi:MAG: redox-sensing transcriptional repressor Rex [Actinomycetota bacterium]|nr:redox-sensing transcriptional repressor Rex [Actinomycetota bacterium]